MVEIATCNIRGIHNSVKRRQVFCYLHDKPYDIILMQETHATKKIQKIWANEWGSQIVFNNGTNNSRGVAILFHRGLKYQLHRTLRDNEGRVLIIDITIAQNRYTIVNIYALNTDDAIFFVDIFEKIESVGNCHRIVGGDFNTILDLADKKGVEGGGTKPSPKMHEAYK